MFLKSVKKWGENTSLVGIPNILRSDKNSLRVIWAVFIIGTMVVFGYGMAQLFLSYMEYSVIEQSYVNTEPYNENFPSVTVCPRQLFHYCAFFYFEYKTGYHSPVFDWMNLEKDDPIWEYYPGCFKLKKTLMDIYKPRLGMYNDIPSPTYFSHKIRRQAIQLIHQHPYDARKAREIIRLDNFRDYAAVSNVKVLSDYLFHRRSALKCEYESASGADIKCTVKLFAHPKFIWCYTVTVEKKTNYLYDPADKLILRFKRRTFPRKSFFQQFLRKFFWSKSDPSEMSELLAIHLHPEEHFPNLDMQSISVQELAISSIKFNQKLDKALNTPKKPCSEVSHAVQHDGNQYITKEEQVCKMEYYQKVTREQCGCRVIDLPNISGNKNTKNSSVSNELPYCNKLDWLNLLNMKNYKNKTRCAATAVITANSNIRKSRLHIDDNTLCLPVCERNFYDYWVDGIPNDGKLLLYSVEWKNTMQHDIDDYLSLNCTENAKTSFCRALRYKMNKNMEKFSRTKEDSETDILDSWTIITVQRESPGVQVTEERLVYSLTSFLSEIGGLASVTLEISPFIIMEIIVVLLMRRPAERRDENQANKQKTGQVMSKVLHKIEEEDERNIQESGS